MENLNPEFSAPVLERIKREAKTLSKALRTGDPIAFARVSSLGWRSDTQPTYMQILDLLSRGNGLRNLHQAVVLARAPDTVASELWVRFRPFIASGEPLLDESGRLTQRLLISGDTALSVCYAPFEHLHQDARLIVVGLTPGLTQAMQALQSARTGLKNGASDADVLRRAKETGAFAGAIRGNLIRLLNAVNVEKLCGYPAERLFSDQRHLIHTTSAVRFPIFKNGENYNGSVTDVPMLLGYVEKNLADELRSLTAPVIALGSHSGTALEHLVRTGRLPASRYLGQLTHPSGANSGRVSEALNGSPETSQYARALQQIKQRISAISSGLPISLKKESNLSARPASQAPHLARSTAIGTGNLIRTVQLGERVDERESNTMTKLQYTVKRGKNAGVILSPHWYDEGYFQAHRTNSRNDPIGRRVCASKAE